MSRYKDWAGWAIDQERTFLAAELRWRKAQQMRIEHELAAISDELERRAEVGEATQAPEGGEPTE